MTRNDSSKPISHTFIVIAVAAVVFILYALHRITLWRKPLL